MRSWPFVSGPSQVNAIVEPAPLAIRYFVSSPSLARRVAGVTAAVVVVPVVVSAFVDRIPTPFCVVVQSRLKNVIVLPLAVDVSPWNAEPKRLINPPDDPAEP